MFQPASRGGEPNRETQSMVPKAFRSCPPHTAHNAYLEPISGSMQKPIEGVYPPAEKIEDRSAIGEKHNQNNVKNTARAYLERIRNSMQKPIEGRSRATPRRFK